MNCWSSNLQAYTGLSIHHHHKTNTCSMSVISLNNIIQYCMWLSIKIKPTLEEPMKACKVSALILGGWSVSHSSCFTPHKDPVHTVQDAGWTPQQVWKGVGVYENISEHSLEAYLSKLFQRTQQRCHEPISCKILAFKTSRNFPNNDMMWGSAEQRDTQTTLQSTAKQTCNLS
jgi:hypothetical protein